MVRGGECSGVNDFSTGPVRVEVEHGVARLTLDRPAKLNALSLELLQRIVDAASAIDRSDAKVVIVCGAGRAFSAGFDLADFGRPADPQSADPHSVGTTGAAADLGRRAAAALEAIAAVTIAAIHGHCVGGGVVLAAACDLRIAAADTRFAIPEIDLGIPLAWGGIPRLVRELGPARTRELVMTGAPFSAADAERFGLLNRVVARDDLDAEVDEWVRTLLAKPSVALRATKQQVRIAAESMASTAHADADAILLGESLRDPEAIARARAYLARTQRG
jgi:enoyl-CoA hydratase/carnithine racemase